MSRSITFRCPDELHERLIEHCRRRKVDATTFITQALRDALTISPRAVAHIEAPFGPQPAKPGSRLKGKKK